MKQEQWVKEFAVRTAGRSEDEIAAALRCRTWKVPRYRAGKSIHPSNYRAILDRMASYFPIRIWLRAA